jgi:hypothetical protein
MPHDDELAALAATLTVLRGLLAGGYGSNPAGEEGWTAKEVVAHLRDCEEFRLARCISIRDEDEPFIAAFDQEQLALDRIYPSTVLTDELAAFGRLRGQVLELLAALDDGGWQRAGLHEQLGRITIEDHIRHAISHDMVHLRQIAESFQPPNRQVK